MATLRTPGLIVSRPASAEIGPDDLLELEEQALSRSSPAARTLTQPQLAILERAKRAVDIWFRPSVRERDELEGKGGQYRRQWSVAVAAPRATLRSTVRARRSDVIGRLIRIIASGRGRVYTIRTSSRRAGGSHMLTPSLAQEIARDISAVIGLNVLITDGEGTVIGSRVGSFHEASVEVLRTQQPATHTASQAHALRGVKPGITLPLVIDSRAVGTVGITGAPGRVRRFGLVVRRQTEILLQESAQLRSRLLREHAVEDLLRDIAAYDAELIEPDFMLFRATELGYDLTLPRVVVIRDVGAPTEAGEANGSSGASGHQHGPSPSRDVSILRSELLRAIREVFSDP